MEYKKIDQGVEELLAILSRRMGSEDILRIKEAYLFAKEAP